MSAAHAIEVSATPLDLTVCVVPHEKISGVYGPSDAGTSDWREAPRSELNSRGVRSFETVSLQEALTKSWPSEALMLNYVVSRDGIPLARQPRVNKSGGGAEWIVSLGFSIELTVIQLDLDTPGHVPWNEKLLSEAEEQASRCPMLRRHPWWYTRKGRRIVLPLRAPIDYTKGEAAIQAALDDARAQGLDPDAACADWTRLQRVPRWRSETGQRFDICAHNLDDAEFYDVPKLRETMLPRKRKATIAAGIDFTATLPPEWNADRYGAISRAVSDVSSEWHTLSLALSGALLERGVSPHCLPALVGAIFAHTRLDTKSRVEDARSTVRRAQAGDSILALARLEQDWPEVAQAVVIATTAATPVAQKPPTADEVCGSLFQLLQDCPDGVSVYATECGVGKTSSLVRVAASRAAGHNPSRRRAKLGTKTVLSVPTNDLARQVVGDARALGIPTLRIFSPASELDAQRRPVCKFADSASALAKAGLSVPWELCRGRDQDACPYLATCPAASGMDGDPKAPFVVGNHGLMGALVAYAGASGLCAIDEPPAVLETSSLTLEDFRVFRANAAAFDAKAFAAVLPVVQALEEWCASLSPSDDTAPVELADAVALWCDAISPEALDAALGATQTQATGDPAADSVACLRAAWSSDRRGAPLRWSAVCRARSSVAYAVTLGAAAGVAWTLWTAFTAEARHVVRTETRSETTVMLITGPNTQLSAALRSSPRTAVLDASPDVHGLSAATGYDLTSRTHTLRSGDGSTISRTLLRWSQGTRGKLFDRHKPLVPVFCSALRAAVAWAQEEPCSALGLITYRDFELLLLGSVNGRETIERDWIARKRSFRDLEEGLELVKAELPEGLTVVPGHYGKTRGLNAWRHVDALVTIADPWPQLGDVRNDALYLGTDGDGRAEWLAKAELEQAHGRLRAPRRTQGGRLLHIGRLVPAGFGWDACEVRVFGVGRPRNKPAMTPDELRAWMDQVCRGSGREAARVLGCSEGCVRNYLHGRREIPDSVSKLVRGAYETPVEVSLQGFRTHPQANKRGNHGTD